MSSVEIEDVLSSIRRLVSEDLRPTSRPMARADVGSKLILTPALRVVTDDDASSDQVSTERAKNEADFLTENEVGDRAADNAVGTVSPLQTLLDDIANGDSHASANAASLPNPAEASGATTTSIEAVVSALGAAVTGQGWEGEADEPDQTVDWSDSAWAERALADVDHIGGEAMALEVVEKAELFSEAEITSDPWSTDDIWLDTSKADTFAPDSSFLDEEVTPAELPEFISETDLADRAEAAAVAEILSVGATAIKDEASQNADIVDDENYRSVLSAIEPTAIDDDDLREMVRDIIREELQGALGERITRNVRKLVRAEINRAIASRDFE